MVSSDSGLPYPILSQPNPTPKYINNVWFQDLIQFMSDNNIKSSPKTSFATVHNEKMINVSWKK